MFKKFLSLPNHCIGVCVKRKIMNRVVGYGVEILAEYIFCGNDKAIQWAKRTLDGVNGNVKKKIKMFKKISCFLLVFCFFSPVRFWGVIFKGIIQTGLEVFVR